MINQTKNPDQFSGNIKKSEVTLALDLGKRRVGVALSHGIIAEAQKTILLNESKPEEFFPKLKKITEEQKVKKIIVGLPLGKNLQETKQSVWTRDFASKIERELRLPIEFVEESFSSTSALEDLKKGKRFKKEEIDAQSAKIILEQYLNSK
ncbi:MAG: Holliday junction resolvase RuvX [Candidatus Berkelbacteria bacterium]|nr:Holliday junction resolvase RuvX [Candidatus Berkelbacteria bacterium]